MAKLVVLGVAGETDLWLVDLTAGTVTPTSSSALTGAAAGSAASIDQLRSTGYSIIKGVDLAVVADDPSATCLSSIDYVIGNAAHIRQVANQLSADKIALEAAGRTGPYSDRVCHPTETVARIRPLFGQIGITRLANITGLDRINIPVWTAVRPNSRTVAVHQGKGIDDASARASAVMEALELAVAERPAVETLLSTARRLLSEGADVLPLEDLTAHGHADLSPDDDIAWTPGYDLLRQCVVWVPAEAVRLDQTIDSAQRRYWQSSDGLASGNLLLEAVLHGLLERVERDATVLWRLRHDRDMQARCIHPDSFQDAVLSNLVAKAENADLRLRLFDITSDIGVPAFLAALGPKGGGRRYWKHFDLSCGTGCHPVPVRAAIRAVTEAAQTRLTTIAGSRDDFLPDLYDATLSPHLRIYLDAEPHLENIPEPSIRESLLDTVLSRLATAAVKRAIVVPLLMADYGFVAKVLVPDLEHPPGDRRRRFGARAVRMMLQ